MKQISINGKEYLIKYTIRALFLFEQITGKPFKIETLLDNYVFFYCLILANNKNNIIEWDDFINAIDDNPNLFSEMNEVLEEENKKNNLFNDNGEAADDSKKK